MIFLFCETLKLDKWPRNTIGHLFYNPEMLKSGQNQQFFVRRELEIWWIILKNNRAPLLLYVKLYASFQSHGWIQTGVTIQKCSICVKISNLLFCVALKFDKRPRKIKGHLPCATSSLVHHFIAISDFKLELEPGNSQFETKSMIFSLVRHEIWQMTLKNNGTPLLC